jgi:hypothetical protein
MSFQCVLRHSDTLSRVMSLNLTYEKLFLAVAETLSSQL